MFKTGEHGKFEPKENQPQKRSTSAIRSQGFRAS